jgi:hypothetical protein
VTIAPAAEAVSDHRLSFRNQDNYERRIMLHSAAHRAA